MDMRELRGAVLTVSNPTMCYVGRTGAGSDMDCPIVAKYGAYICMRPNTEGKPCGSFVSTRAGPHTHTIAHHGYRELRHVLAISSACP
eukprot:7236196-Pyramimonas_sp.AAC.1